MRIITKDTIKKLQEVVNQKATEVGRTSNEKIRSEFDRAVNDLIEAEKLYASQCKTKEVEYIISLRPLGRYVGVITIWEDATKEEIESAILEDCEYFFDYSDKEPI